MTSGFIRSCDSDRLLPRWRAVCTARSLRLRDLTRGEAIAASREPSLAFDDRDHFDLDHRLGLRQAADLDCRAGRAGDSEIAHAHIAVLREFLVVGDEGIGLDHVFPGRAGRLEAEI